MIFQRGGPTVHNPYQKAHHTAPITPTPTLPCTTNALATLPRAAAEPEKNLSRASSDNVKMAGLQTRNAAGSEPRVHKVIQ